MTLSDATLPPVIAMSGLASSADHLRTEAAGLRWATRQAVRRASALRRDRDPDGGIYYDAHPIEQMSYHLTMLAYDMNDEPLDYGHGASVRLRNELQLGFRQVKWIKGVEFVKHPSPRSAAVSAGTTRTTNSSATGRPPNLDPR